MKAYVYAIVVDGVVRYIGKGSGNRTRAHMRLVRSIARRRAVGETVKTSHFYNRLTKEWLAGAEIQEVILADGLTHEDAYLREIAEIARLQDQLWNLWAGGEGSSKGYAKPPQQRQKIAKSNQQTWTDSKLLAEHSERCKLVWLRPEYREKCTGRKWTPEMRAALSAKRKAQWADPEFKAKMEAAFSSPEFHSSRSEATLRGWQTRRAKKQ
jgi:hypothetical protein